MAGRARDILIRFLGDDKDLRKTTQSVANETGKIAKGFSAVSGAVKGLVAAGAIRVLQGMAEAAAAEADEQTKLATVLKNTTKATDAQITSVEKWVSAMQMATNVADTDLRQALQSLTVAGLSVAESQDAISVAVDIAAAKGLELNSVINGFVKAQFGSVTGLARLGLATKNAAGETLSFDQILKGAADTMGGTARRAAFDLAGQMDQVAIAFQEIQEKPSAFARWLVRVQQGFLLMAESIADVSNELPQARTLLNELVMSGIDPFTQRAEAMSTVLINLRNSGFNDLNDAIQFLKVALGATEVDMLNARAQVIEFGASLGLTADQVREVADELTGALRADAVNRWTEAQQAAATGTRDFTAALEEQRNAMKEATDPLFASQRANERLTEAHDKYTRATIEHGEASEEAQSALSDLTQAKRDADSANAAFRENFSQETIDAIRQWGIDMGISASALERWVNAQRAAAGLPPISLPGIPTQGQNVPGFGEGARRSVGGITEPSQGDRGGNVTYNNHVTVVSDYTDANAARRTAVEIQREQQRLARERVN
jgi:hypothetical protein